MTARGVIDTSPITYFCTCPVCHCRKNLEQYSTFTYIIMECLAGWQYGMITLNYECSYDVFCAHLAHDHAVYHQASNQNPTRYNMSYEGCYVMFRYLT